MASALQIHSQHDDMPLLPDPVSPPATPASVPGVAYDLKRLKVYSSCLRCRAKKVKCDRKEPCSRCEKHSVECSYRELASVQLDIRQFQRHLNNPKIRKDGSGIITSTATPVITMTPSPSPLSSSSAPNAPLAARSALTAVIPSKSSSLTGALSPASSTSLKNFTSTSSPSGWSASTTINTFALYPGSNNERSQTGTSGSTDTDSDSNHRSSNNPSRNRPRVHKVHRRKPSKGFGLSLDRDLDRDHALHADLRAISDHVDRVQLSEDAMAPDTSMSSASDGEGAHEGEGDMDNKEDGDDHDSNHDLQEDVPIWRVQAMGKHKQTAHEQDMAETFGLAAYLKAREMEIAQDPERAGQTLDFEMELEKALAQRMPSSFSRPDRSFSRARKNAPNGYSPKMPYARPSYCQLSPGNNKKNSHRHGSNGSSPASGAHSASLNALLSAAQCCCQISALQGQALNVCPYSNVSHSGYEKPRLTLSSSATVVPDSATQPSGTESTSLPPPSAPKAAEGARIAYSPSYSPTYNPRDVPPVSTAATRATETPQSSYPSPQEQESPLWQYTPSSKLFSSSSSTFVFNSARLPSLSVAAPCLTPDACSMDVDVAISSPRTELAPILSLPTVTSTVSSSSSTTPSSDLTAFQVGKDGEAPIQIECKYNEPNVDAWDMIEKPISRTIPLTTKRGRSIKMEMGWILS
ncbi:hypothetical protein EMPS_04361 [Entomortierella parvispora]|uniref:Zn(2)-C6 fungal-type domain-containing protein n=1 Tax=Entomortierella parvispora TaxID=205924 RepID=A0A9P3H8F7_9FUNG|nr:hypothetical protein EMPS_04361 [Entomortierella parvispora]